MRIGIKYCGGCNPRFDRRGLVRRMEKQFPDCEFVFAGSEGIFDIVAVVCGCSSGCALHENLVGLAGKVIIACKEDEIILTELVSEQKSTDRDEGKHGIS